MPFADDIRKYTFASLEKLISKNGEEITKHPYIPTESQQEAMDNFVDAMDLMAAGEKDEEGHVKPIALQRLLSNMSYNPGIAPPGLTLQTRITLQSIGSNKPCSTVLLSPTSQPIHSHLRTPSSSNISNHPENSSNVPNQPLSKLKKRSKSSKYPNALQKEVRQRQKKVTNMQQKMMKCYCSIANATSPRRIRRCHQ